MGKIAEPSAPVPAEPYKVTKPVEQPVWSGHSCPLAFDLDLTSRLHARATLFPTFRQPLPLILRWERDSPKVLRPIALFDKFDGVGGNSLSGSHLRDDPRRDLGTTVVSHDHDRAHHQFALELDGRPMPIEIGGSCCHRKRAFLPILTREPHRTVQGHPIASPLSHLNPIQG
jgi:hypothetical protein